MEKTKPLWGITETFDPAVESCSSTKCTTNSHIKQTGVFEVVNYDKNCFLSLMFLHYCNIDRFCKIPVFREKSLGTVIFNHSIVQIKNK